MRRARNPTPSLGEWSPGGHRDLAGSSTGAQRAAQQQGNGSGPAQATDDWQQDTQEIRHHIEEDQQLREQQTMWIQTTEGRWRPATMEEQEDLARRDMQDQEERAREAMEEQADAQRRGRGGIPRLPTAAVATTPT